MIEVDLGLDADVEDKAVVIALMEQALADLDRMTASCAQLAAAHLSLAIDSMR